MGFIPPLNLGNFQPSPATLSQWIYQIWQYLQENPIATQEQLQEYIGNFITTSPETQTMIGEGVKQYLTDNPPTAPVQSVQGKTGAVQLAYNEIVPASNAVPVYKASSTPSTNTLTGQYNLGYRLFVNTATQEIFTISPAGALSLVGRGKIDGTTIDLNTAQGDTTIAEAVTEIQNDVTELQTLVDDGIKAGDIVNLQGSVNGYLTGGGRGVRFTLILGKKVSATEFSMSNFTATLRGVGGYIGSNSGENFNSSDYTITTYINDANIGVVTVSITKQSDFTGSPQNNTPINVQVLTGSMVFA